MPTIDRRPAVAGLLLALLASLTLSLPLSPASRASETDETPPCPSPCWTITSRVISQEQAHGQVWQADYVLRLDAPPSESVVLTPSNVQAVVDGWVSNSRVAGHATPRRSTLSISGLRSSSESEVLSARDESRRCRERGALLLWPADSRETPLNSIYFLTASASLSPVQSLPIVIPGGTSVRIRLRLEHDHFLYGPYEPLLGTRSLTLRLASAQVRDTLPMDQELCPARSLDTWPLHQPTPDRLDPEVFVSPPHSLHLEAHIPGNGYFRFTGPVRYSARVKLTYWYLVAPGTEGETRERITQLKQGTLREGGSVYRSLPDGEQEHFLTTEGRWTHVERVFLTESEATSLTAEFRLSGDVGEMWLDDVTLEPLGEAPSGP